MVSFAFFNCYADYGQFHSFIVMLSVIMLSAAIVSVSFFNCYADYCQCRSFIVMLSVIMLSAAIISVAFFNHYVHYAEWQIFYYYAECHYADRRGTHQSIQCIFKYHEPKL